MKLNLYPKKWAMLSIATAFASLSLCGTASASDNVPTAAQKKPMMLTGATIHTVSGATLTNSNLLFDKGRIVAVGNNFKAPDGAQIIDVSGKHIYPGMISANTVMGLAEVQSVRATLDYAEVGAINPNARAVVAINPDSELIPVARANGVLATLSAPQAGPAGMINGISTLIQMEGWTWEEMALEPELGLHITIPMLRFSPDMFPPPFDTRLEEMRKNAGLRVKMLEDAFESALAYRKAKADNPALPVDVRWEAMLPVLDGRRKVFMHANDITQIRFALNFAERYQLKMVLVGAADSWRVADVLKARQVPVIIGGVHAMPLRRSDPYDTQYSLAAKLSQAGVQFCIGRPGTDDDAPNERNLPFEAGTAVTYGLDKDEALKAITLYPAQILGVADRLGSIETGKLASFFVTDGDPMETATKVEQIYIQGRLVDNTSHQSRLTEKYLKKYQQKKEAAMP
jgi:imidazolonepropionase-like amidohydrolase